MIKHETQIIGEKVVVLLNKTLKDGAEITKKFEFEIPKSMLVDNPADFYDNIGAGFLNKSTELDSKGKPIYEPFPVRNALPKNEKEVLSNLGFTPVNLFPTRSQRQISNHALQVMLGVLYDGNYHNIHDLAGKIAEDVGVSWDQSNQYIRRFITTKKLRNIGHHSVKVASKYVIEKDTKGKYGLHSKSTAGKYVRIRITVFGQEMPGSTQQDVLTSFFRFIGNLNPEKLHSLPDFVRGFTRDHNKTTKFITPVEVVKGVYYDAHSAWNERQTMIRRTIEHFGYTGKDVLVETNVKRPKIRVREVVTL